MAESDIFVGNYSDNYLQSQIKPDPNIACYPKGVRDFIWACRAELGKRNIERAIKAIRSN